MTIKTNPKNHFNYRLNSIDCYYAIQLRYIAETLIEFLFRYILINKTIKRKSYEMQSNSQAIPRNTWKLKLKKKQLHEIDFNLKS